MTTVISSVISVGVIVLLVGATVAGVYSVIFAFDSSSVRTATQPGENVTVTSGTDTLHTNFHGISQCVTANYSIPTQVNNTFPETVNMSSQHFSPDLPGLTYFGKLNVSVSEDTPVSVATNASGFAYGVFQGTQGYYLAVSKDLVHWSTVTNSVIPDEYQISWGMGLGITSSGLILVSATTLVTHQNFTIFRLSSDYGRSFQTVLNISLRAEPQTYTNLSTGPGDGFWHGVAETSNGYLFVGLYNPQGLIFRSTDQGRSWQLVFNASRNSNWHNEIHDVEVDPSNNFVYATTDDEAGGFHNQSMIVSTDYGNHWTTVYNALEGGAGLPLHLVLTSISFLDSGRLLATGLEGYYSTQYSHALFILKLEPNGCLQAIYQVNAPDNAVDPFITWWMPAQNQSSLFVLTRAGTYNHTLGIGLFTLSDNGTLTMLMKLKGNDTSLPTFMQMIGPVNGHYGVLAFSNNRLYFLIF